MSEVPREVPAQFVHAVEQIRTARPRPEVHLEEIPAPQRIAPHAIALSAQAQGTRDGEELATGRFVLLYDPDGQEAWSGTTRAVTYVRAPLEPEMADDPMLAEVGWSWLTENLARAKADPAALGGTVTRVLSASFGSLRGRDPGSEIEVRASWTVHDEVAPHLLGWSELLCTVAGLPPLPEGVSALRRRVH